MCTWTSAITASRRHSCTRPRSSRASRIPPTLISMRRWRATSAAAAPTCGSVPRSSGREADHMARTLSRRTFLEASAAVGGGLLLGFSLPVPRRVQNDWFAPNAFIRVDRDGRVTLIMHKVEMGQGTYTSMPMLLAEELEVDLSQAQRDPAPAA